MAAASNPPRKPSLPLALPPLARGRGGVTSGHDADFWTSGGVAERADVHLSPCCPKVGGRPPASTTLAPVPGWVHDGTVEGAPRLTVGGRTWFDDADRPGRRLAVHSHPEWGWVTVSVWEGEECRGTFHLRPADAPHLIYGLAEGLADLGASRPLSVAVAPPSAPWQSALVAATSGVRRTTRWLLARGGPPPVQSPSTGLPRLRSVADPGPEPDSPSG